MTYERSILSNGIPVITVPMPSFESVTIDIWVRVGSRYEPANINGISHFLEHTILDGGKKYTTSNKIWTAIDSVGGNMNAGTSKLYTNYYTKLHKDHARLGFDLLSDALLYARFDPKDVKKERTIILDEITMGNDNPKSIVWKNFDRLMFNGDALSREVIGTKDIVSKMEREDLINYKLRHYVAENMVISTAGSVPHDEILKLAEEYFGDVPRDGDKKNTHPKTTIKIPKDRIHLHTKDTEQTSFVFGFPSYGDPDHPKRYAQQLLRVILGAGASSRLFLTIREKHALAYSVGNTSGLYPGAGYYAAYAGTDPKNASHAFKLMLEEFEKIKSAEKGTIKKSEFEKAKNFIKGHTALSLESSSAVSENVGYDELIYGKIEMPDEYLDKIEQVSIEEVYQVANEVFDFGKLMLSIIGPHKDTIEFEKVLGQ